MISPVPLRRLALSLLILTSGINAASPNQQPVPLFRDVAAEVGLNFYHFTGATGEFYMPEIMGAGVALFDYDNDGDLDVYLVQGTTLDPSKTPAQSLFPPLPGWKPGNRLFKNLLKETGKLRFVDVSDQAHVGYVGYGMGVAVGDYNNDGWQDLYLTNFGSNVLYRNNGDGTFTDVTSEAGVNDPHWSSSAAWLDYDGDGNLDLFVANYLDFTIKANKRCYAAMGEADYCTPQMYRPLSARLFHNLGNGKFADVTQDAGIGSAPGPGLGVLAADFNGDGLIDIYVANDGAANRLWLNQGNASFKEVGLASGTAYNGDGLAQAGMGVTAGDISNRGIEDILVTNLTREGTVLYRNDGKGNFYDATAEFGLLQPTFPFTGFGAHWFDYDNDGFLDLFIANGAVTRMESLRGSAYPFQQVNQLFHNDSGKRFVEVTRSAGPVFTLAEVSRGAAFGDINNDGKIDIVVTNNNGPVRLLLNQTNSHNHWLELKLEQPSRNRYAISARVELRQRGHKLLRRVHADGSYLSASDVRVHFGLGEDPRIESVVVTWPDGARETWDKIESDRIMTLRRGTGHAQ